MIEQGIYFALGCIITALAALAFAPFFWSRALRLSRRRLQLQIPLSMQEILAERDGLRAEFAVERLRIEQAMDRVQASKAADMAAIGRHGVTAAKRADEILGLKRAAQAQDIEISRLSSELAATVAEAGAVKLELFHAVEQGERRAQDLQVLESERQRLSGLGEGDRKSIASLEQSISNLEAEFASKSAERSTDPREEGLAASMRSRLEVAMAHATRHETSSLSLRRELDEAKARIRSLEADRHAGPGVDADAADAGLRSSIHSLGLAVATMTREGRIDPSGIETRSRNASSETPSAIDAN